MPGLPILSSLTDLISGTFEKEEFKKLFQPASLAVAGVFLALNLVLVYPVLVEKNVGVVLALGELSTAWQVILGTLMLFFLGYIIGSMGGFFISILNGDAFTDSLFGTFLRQRKRKKFMDLRKKFQDAADDKDLDEEEKTNVAKIAHRLAYEYPSDAEQVAGTRLGNTLRSVHSYTLVQHGAHLDTLWPHVNFSLKTENSELQERIQSSREALMFLSALTVILAFVALEFLVSRLAIQDIWTAILGCIALLAAAYITYSSAIQKAAAWAKDVRMAFDLYLDKVGASFGLKDLPKEDVEDRKKRWQGVSQWLAYGGLNLKDTKYAQPAPPWSKTVSAPGLNIQAAPTISVVNRSGATALAAVKDDDTHWCLARKREVVLSMTNEDKGEHALPARGAYVVVKDPEITDNREEVEGELSGPTRIQAIIGRSHPGDAKTRLWQLPKVSERSSHLLKYTAREALMSLELIREPGSARVVIDQVQWNTENGVVAINIRCEKSGTINFEIVAEYQGEFRPTKLTYHQWELISKNTHDDWDATCDFSTVRCTWKSGQKTVVEDTRLILTISVPDLTD